MLIESKKTIVLAASLFLFACGGGDGEGEGNISGETNGNLLTEAEIKNMGVSRFGYDEGDSQNQSPEPMVDLSILSLSLEDRYSRAKTIIVNYGEKELDDIDINHSIYLSTSIDQLDRLNPHSDLLIFDGPAINRERDKGTENGALTTYESQYYLSNFDKNTINNIPNGNYIAYALINPPTFADHFEERHYTNNVHIVPNLIGVVDGRICEEDKFEANPHLEAYDGDNEIKFCTDNRDILSYDSAVNNLNLMSIKSSYGIESVILRDKTGKLIAQQPLYVPDLQAYYSEGSYIDVQPEYIDQHALIQKYYGYPDEYGTSNVVWFTRRFFGGEHIFMWESAKREIYSIELISDTQGPGVKYLVNFR